MTAGRRRVRRLFPDGGEIDLVEAVAGLAGQDLLALNMVSSVDGRAALEGRTAALGSEVDRELFHVLRAQADAILVGPGTLRAERYGRFTKNDELRELRAGAGLAEEPLGIVMTRSGELPWDIPLFQDAGARVAVYTTSELEAPDVPAAVSVHHLEHLDPPDVLGHARAEHGVRCVVCEGGPTLNGPLFTHGVVDELFVTLSPQVAGGVSPLTMVEGALPGAVPLELRQVLEESGELLLRYRAVQDG